MKILSTFLEADPLYILMIILIAVALIASIVSVFVPGPKPRKHCGVPIDHGEHTWGGFRNSAYICSGGYVV